MVNVQGSPPQSSGMVHPHKEEVKHKCHEACVDEQGAPGQIQAQKGRLKRMEGRVV